jgi:hypothetical protein
MSLFFIGAERIIFTLRKMFTVQTNFFIVVCNFHFVFVLIPCAYLLGIHILLRKKKVAHNRKSFGHIEYPMAVVFFPVSHEPDGTS